MITQPINHPIERFGGTFPESKFTIKADGKVFKNLISSIYSDPVRAVIRENCANALDSHRMAGREDRPFEVTLPTVFQSNLIIRDFGTGMSREFLETKYTVAFYSSKDQSNKCVGAIGIGRMSLLSICQSYIATSFQNGIKRTYTVYYSEDGVPSIAFLTEEETDEPDGFCLDAAIDASRVTEFQSKAQEALSCYKVKPIIHNGDPIKDVPFNFVLESKEAGKWGVTGDHKSYCIMDVYKYPLNADSIPGLDIEMADLIRCGLIMNFDLGELNTATSREQLEYNKTTINTLKARLAEVVAELKEQIVKDFESKTLFDKISFCNSLFAYNGRLASIKSFASAIRKNVNIPDEFDFSDFTVRQFYLRWMGDSKPTEDNHCSIAPADNLVFFYTDKKSYLLRRAKKFLADPANVGKRMVCLLPNKDSAVADFEKSHGVDASKFTLTSTLDFDASTAIRAKRPVDHQYVFTGSRYARDAWQLRAIEPEEEVYYTPRKDWECVSQQIRKYCGSGRDGLKKSQNLLKGLGCTKDITIIGFTEKQIADGKADAFEDYHEYFKDFTEEWIENSKADLDAYRYQEVHYGSYPEEIYRRMTLKPDSFAMQVKDEYERLCAQLKGKLYLGTFAKDRVIPADISYKLSWNALDEKYPLIRVIRHYSYRANDAVWTDLQEYMNNKG